MSETWDSSIDLGKYIEVREHGEILKSLEWIEVFANKKSIRQTEFYEARKLGLKPELEFGVNSFEFDNHDKFRYEGKEYDIIRTYCKGEITELVGTSFTRSEV